MANPCIHQTPPAKPDRRWFFKIPGSVGGARLSRFSRLVASSDLASEICGAQARVSDECLSLVYRAFTKKSLEAKKKLGIFMRRRI